MGLIFDLNGFEPISLEDFEEVMLRIAGLVPILDIGSGPTDSDAFINDVEGRRRFAFPHFICITLNSSISIITSLNLRRLHSPIRCCSTPTRYPQEVEDCPGCFLVSSFHPDVQPSLQIFVGLGQLGFGFDPNLSSLGCVEGPGPTGSFVDPAAPIGSFVVGLVDPVDPVAPIAGPVGFAPTVVVVVARVVLAVVPTGFAVLVVPAVPTAGYVDFAVPTVNFAVLVLPIAALAVPTVNFVGPAVPIAVLVLLAPTAALVAPVGLGSGHENSLSRT